MMHFLSSSLTPVCTLPHNMLARTADGHAMYMEAMGGSWPAAQVEPVADAGWIVCGRCMASQSAAPSSRRVGPLTVQAARTSGATWTAHGSECVQGGEQLVSSGVPGADQQNSRACKEHGTPAQPGVQQQTLTQVMFSVVLNKSLTQRNV